MRMRLMRASGAGMAGALDLLGCLLALAGSLPPATWLALHLLAVAGGALFVASLVPRGSRIAWAGLAFFFGGVLPGSGLAAVALSAVTARPDGRGELLARCQERLSWNRPEPRTLWPIAATEDRLRQELSIQPLLETLKNGSPKERQRVFMALARCDSPHCVPVLTEALGDADPEVRFQAGLTLVRLEERYVQRLQQATGGGPATAGEAAARTLGDACWEYAVSGLVEGAGRTRLLERARDAYLAEARRDPGDVASSLALARVFAALGDPRQALAHAERCLASRPDWAEALVLQGEALFALRRLDALPAVGHRLLALPPGALPEAAAEVAGYWADTGRKIA
ncbi:MAG: HEAT repeat domain-containing protein [Candidatus Sericytochromatia bacterium]|nr:HEAT repeat domain-containing protein [Candidatus Tanganyikabacteria bacterium]